MLKALIGKLFGDTNPPSSASGNKAGKVNVRDRVRIVHPETGVPDPAGFGQVMMIVDGTDCEVLLDDGRSAFVKVNQLRKVS